mmetsp:Transcript_22529/g.54190  ORF Transcript_22529/g.54190 Transcript_22529/m.54190 type:complete len:202 (-) Transcript_22529:878-1483(-)
MHEERGKALKEAKHSKDVGRVALELRSSLHVLPAVVRHETDRNGFRLRHSLGGREHKEQVNGFTCSLPYAKSCCTVERSTKHLTDLHDFVEVVELTVEEPLDMHKNATPTRTRRPPTPPQMAPMINGASSELPLVVVVGGGDGDDSEDGGGDGGGGEVVVVVDDEEDAPEMAGSSTRSANVFLPPPPYPLPLPSKQGQYAS